MDEPKIMTSEEQRQELLRLATPLMDWLRDNWHPHVKVLVDSEHAELLEGVAAGYRKETE